MFTSTPEAAMHIAQLRTLLEEVPLPYEQVAAKILEIEQYRKMDGEHAPSIEQKYINHAWWYSYDALPSLIWDRYAIEHTNLTPRFWYIHASTDAREALLQTATCSIDDDERIAWWRARLAQHAPDRLPIEQFRVVARISRNYNTERWIALRRVFSYKEILEDNLTCSEAELDEMLHSFPDIFCEHADEYLLRNQSYYIKRNNIAEITIDPSGGALSNIRNIDERHSWYDLEHAGEPELQQHVIEFVVKPERLEVSLRSPLVTLRHIEEMGDVVRAIMPQKQARHTLLPYYESAQLDDQDRRKFDKIKEERVQEYQASNKWYAVLQSDEKQIKVAHASNLAVGQLVNKVYW